VAARLASNGAYIALAEILQTRVEVVPATDLKPGVAENVLSGTIAL